jgi:hypothetical protein
MRENGLLAPHRIRKRPNKAHDGTITTMPRCETYALLR